MIGTLLERKSRIVFLVSLRAKNVKTVAENFSEIFEEIVPEIKKSLTYVGHKEFTKRTGIPVYFADLHIPLKRESYENPSMLLRDFFLKEADLSKVTKEKIKWEQNYLNERLRQILGWKTPKKIFFLSTVFSAICMISFLKN